MAEKRYEIHLVSHTHWDREWYRTFQETRMRLVRLIDKLLRILDSNPDYRYFVLDGQAIILDDYLEVRPEKEELLKRHISEGRILVGPWYISPDEFLVSGEALIRNLILGHKIATDFGRVMNLGYVPDQFGHISQLPQILRGFGIYSAIFARGLGEEEEKLGSEFLWRAPDESEVLAIHQVVGFMESRALGYEDPDESGNTKEPLNLRKALETVNRNKFILTRYARTRYLLFNNGEDFYESQPEIPEIIKYLNANLEDTVIVHSNYEEFISKIDSSCPKLDYFEGELRAAKYWFILSGVLSTRMYLKQSNERTQSRLEKIAEPLATLAWLEDLEYPGGLLWQAWKYLLQCQSHDSICGCGIDEVHRDVMLRFSWSQQISVAISKASFDHIASRIDTTFSNSNSQPIIVLNSLSWTRRDIGRVKLLHSKEAGFLPNFVVFDSNGKKALSQISKIKKDQGWKQREIEISFLAEDIPPYGYRVYFLAPSYEKESRPSALKVSGDTIENEYFQIQVNKNGTLRISDKTSDVSFDGLLLFEDVEDAGDEYNFSPARVSRRITTENCEAEVTVQERGPVFATLKIEVNLNLPKGLLKDRSARSEKLVKCSLQSYVTLYSGVRRIDFRTVFENRVKDHRLRVIFPTNIRTDYSYAESQFDVVRRKIALPSTIDWKELPSPTHPQQSFVNIGDDKKGLTLINQGLPEYEAFQTENGTALALTLLRCVGWLSRGDLLTRRGDAGPRLYPQIYTPEAQCLGRQEFRYSLILHEGDWKDNKVWQEAYNHNVPLLGQQTSQHQGPLPKEFTFLEIRPETLVVSTLKKAESKERLILRAYNPEPKRTEAEVVMYKKIKRAYLLSLDEKLENRRGGRLKFSENKILFTIAPSQIITIGIDF